MKAKTPMCPLCGSAFHEKNFEGVLVRRCSGCDGAWLHEEELKLILETTDLPAGSGPSAPALNRQPVPQDQLWNKSIGCPECGEVLQAFQFMVSSGVYLEYCPKNHGIWLDAGELQELLFLRAELLRRDAEKRKIAFPKAHPNPNSGLASRLYETLH